MTKRRIPGVGLRVRHVLTTCHAQGLLPISITIKWGCAQNRHAVRLCVYLRMSSGEGIEFYCVGGLDWSYGAVKLGQEASNCRLYESSYSLSCHTRW
jgi:hypothetical protein